MPINSADRIRRGLISVICFLIIFLSSVCTEQSVYAADISAPKSVKATNVSLGVSIKWSKVKSADGYYIYRRKPNAVKFSRIANISGRNATSYIDKTAPSFGNYRYAVKAYSKSGTSGYKISDKIYYIKAPKIKSIKNNYGSVTVKWQKVAGASGYYLYRKTNNNKWKRLKTFKSDNKLSYTDKSVVNGRKYTYAVKACKQKKRSVLGLSDSVKFKKTKVALSINKSKLNLYYRKSATLVATPTIKGVTVKWKSTDPSVATVNTKGKVETVSVGTTKITAYFVYNGKKYKDTCSVTVKEKTYGIGDTVNLEGKAAIKIESAYAHTLCRSEAAPHNTDKVIITYSYKNISCSGKIKIDSDDFVLSDCNGIVGCFTEDCLHRIPPNYCAEGDSQRSAVAVGCLKKIGKYCNLKLILNVPNYGKVTAKFKLKINRNYSHILSDDNAFGVLGSSLNALLFNEKGKSSIKVTKAVYCGEENLDINNKTISGSVFVIRYSDIDDDCKTNYRKILLSDAEFKSKDWTAYRYKKRYLYIKKLKSMPKYKIDMNIQSLLSVYKSYPLPAMIY